MSSSTEPTAVEQNESLKSTLGYNWRLLLVAGIIVGVLGFIAVLAPFVTGISVAILVGALLVVGGIMQLVGAFRSEGWRGFVWQLALGAVTLIAGIAVFLNPLVGLMTLTLLVIGYLLASGVIEVVMGVQLRGEKNWIWTVASGVIGILLAVLLWSGFPSTALWAVGVIFGVNLLVTGASMVALAIGARGVAEPADEAGAAPGVGGA